MIWRGTIIGEPVSKANSREIVRRGKGGAPFSIKSKKARKYADDVARQIVVMGPVFEGDVHVKATLYYASRRPDLDASVLLDAMQGKVFRNDRQVMRLTLTKALDPANPRAEVEVMAA